MHRGRSRQTPVADDLRAALTAFKIDLKKHFGDVSFSVQLVPKQRKVEVYEHGTGTGKKKPVVRITGPSVLEAIRRARRVILKENQE
jgi:hypothetical protein